jgi:UDP-N-acetylglucosamine 2-epimerase (non-hydrolysing)
MFGTRPEAIKLAPVVQALSESDFFAPYVIVTAQHRGMLDSVLEFFRIRPDHDLDLFRPGHTPSGVMAGAISGLAPVLAKARPDFVLVQGDTTTTLASALTAFYEGIPVGHVEAGLRTHNPAAPFPEEINRRLTTHVASLHFAPTAIARQNLLDEGISGADVMVTGNTVIDALSLALERPRSSLVQRYEDRPDGRRLLLVTAHRRESWGEGLRRVAGALAELADDPSNHIVFPVHGNPAVSEAVAPFLQGRANVDLTAPLGYGDFVQIMALADLILSDSGGIQEEAPFLGTPVLVMRDVTERPEAVEAGTAYLVGTDPARIVNLARAVLADPERFNPTSRFLFGDGCASMRIVSRLAAHFQVGVPPEEFSPYRKPSI